MLYFYRGFLLSDLNEIKNFIDGFMNDIKDQFCEDDLFKIRLVLNELIVNSYEHGNESFKEKKIEVVIMINEDFIMFKIIDEGDGIPAFIPKDFMSDSGRGLKLVNYLSDEFFVSDNKVTVILNSNKSGTKHFV